MYPGPDFQTSTLDVHHVPAGTVWLRILPDLVLPTMFADTVNRFSDPARPRRFKTLYAGTSFEVCFLETIVRDLRDGKCGVLGLGAGLIAQRKLVRLMVETPLHLADLRHPGRIRMGVPSDAVGAASHRLGQIWSGALWAHPRAIDGIIFPSRLSGDACVVLFDRAAGKFAAIAQTALTDPTLKPAIDHLLAAYRLTLT